MVPVTLNLEPILIKTTEALGSDKLLSVRLFKDNEKHTITIKFSNQLQYKISECGDEWVNIVNCDADLDVRIWRISKENKNLLLTCNDSKVFSIQDVIDEIQDENTKFSCQTSWITSNQGPLWLTSGTSVSYRVKAG